MAEKEDLPQTFGIREKTVTDFDSVLFMKRKAKARTEEQMRIVAIEISGGGGMVMNLTEVEVKEVTGATATAMKIVREEETGVTETVSRFDLWQWSFLLSGQVANTATFAYR
jgi:hypothetical protein